MDPKRILYLYFLIPIVLYIIPIFNISNTYEEIFAMITAHIITVLIVTKIFVSLNNKKWKIELRRDNVWKFSLVNTIIALVIGQGILFGLDFFIVQSIGPIG